jgi:hypothetical protein
MPSPLFPLGGCFLLVPCTPETTPPAQSGGLLLDLDLDQHPHNVALFHYEVLDAIDFDLGARPFAEQDAVANLDVDRDELAALVAAAGSNGDDFALLRLLLGSVGNDDATSGLRLGIDSLDDDAVVKRSKVHRVIAASDKDEYPRR